VIETLNQLTEGMPVLWGGDRVTRVDAALARAFQPGDQLIVVQEDGALLHLPKAEADLARAAVTRAQGAFPQLAAVPDAAITAFYEGFARRLADDAVWKPIDEANAADVETAKARGRATGRLLADARMRADMIAGLRLWRDAPGGRDRLVERVEHQGWSVEQRTAPLGVVGFVFEGRPNVFADAAGVIRGGNTVVFRIGSDALGTARAIRDQALAPALREAGLPEGAAVLIDSAAHAAGWALFADSRLSLAVARGSGPAVAQLGAVARQAGVPVSLHGTGGAWIIADHSADVSRFAATVLNSLDRKVCNTLNTCCIVRARASDLVPAFLESLAESGRKRGEGAILHFGQGELAVPAGVALRPLADTDLGREWEWDTVPEVSLFLVDSVDEAVSLFNAQSPRFVASLVAEDDAAQEAFYARIDAAFVGDGFTRWVDGQYAFLRPELGLSNWQSGRLFARGGVLSGDGVYTVRARMRQREPGIRR
jgi:glutamate-5-semialdehyde dehydrogenase